MFSSGIWAIINLLQLQEIEKGGTKVYKDCIQNTLDKIEVSLKDEIDAEMLSQEAGY